MNRPARMSAVIEEERILDFKMHIGGHSDNSSRNALVMCEI